VLVIVGVVCVVVWLFVICCWWG